MEEGRRRRAWRKGVGVETDEGKKKHEDRQMIEKEEEIVDKV